MRGYDDRNTGMRPPREVRLYPPLFRFHRQLSPRDSWTGSSSSAPLPSDRHLIRQFSVRIDAAECRAGTRQFLSVHRRCQSLRAQCGSCRRRKSGKIPKQGCFTGLRRTDNQCIQPAVLMQIRRDGSAIPSFCRAIRILKDAMSRRPFTPPFSVMTLPASPTL